VTVRHAPLAAAVAAALLLGSFPGRAAAAAVAWHRAAPAPARVGIEVDTTGLRDDERDPVAQQIEERAQGIWLAAEVLPARSDDDPVVRVTVKRPSPEEDTYAIEVVAYDRKGGAALGAPQTHTCETCTEGEMLDEVAALLGPMLSRAVVAAARGGDGAAGGPDSSESSEPAGGDEEPAASSEAPATTDRARSDRAPLGTLGKVGIGLSVAGAVGLATGLGLALAPDRVQSGSGGRTGVTTRPPGYALLGTGGAVLVTGIVLVALDRVRARRRAVALVPSVGAGGGLLVVTGRF